MAMPLRQKVTLILGHRDVVGLTVGRIARNGAGTNCSAGAAQIPADSQQEPK